MSTQLTDDGFSSEVYFHAFDLDDDQKERSAELCSMHPDEVIGDDNEGDFEEYD